MMQHDNFYNGKHDPTAVGPSNMSPSIRCMVVKSGNSTYGNDRAKDLFDEVF